MMKSLILLSGHLLTSRVFITISMKTSPLKALPLKNSMAGLLTDDMLVYSTKPALVEFEHEGWGSYEVLGFMAEKYFAGYPENTFGNSKSISVLSDSILSKVLIDDDNKKSLFTGSSLALENGYSLKAAEVDVNGERVLFELYKDGKAAGFGNNSSEWGLYLRNQISEGLKMSR